MNRRSFIKGIGLLTGSAFISLHSNAFSGTGTITGKVLDGRRGIPNVAISDGYSVVITNSKGEYTITPNDGATHLWMSTPSGYEFKTNYNIANQYQQLQNTNQYDFKLKRLKKNDNKHHFIIWADPQVKNKKDVKQMMETAVPDTLSTIDDIGKNELIHGICVGDIVWDNHSLFPDYNAAVAQMGIPFFQALGNHDMDYRQGGDETSDRTFKEVYGPTYYSFNRGKAHYVVLDDVRYLGSERLYDGYITENQLEWLAKDLKYVDKEKLLIICLHIPVHSAVKNNTALYSLLEGYKNVHIMSGHTHYNTNVIKNGIYEHNHGTVCGAWWTGPICEDGTPRGYGVYEVDGTDLKWHYKSTGLEKSKQVNIYVDKLENQQRLVANVWNWDPEWKVEYVLDDKPMGALEQLKGYDPQAVELYKGDKLPMGRTFAEPRKTDHLFLAHFDPSIKKVTVNVTDRFGNKYTVSTESKNL